MNAKTKQEKTAQVHCLYRLRDVCRSNGFKSVQHTNVTKQFLLAVDALKEEAKFLKYLGELKFPPDLATIHHNLLRSTTLDNSISSNKGN